MPEKIRNTTSFIRNRLGISPSTPPEVGIVLGSGLGALTERIEVSSTLSYSEIPDFPRSTVEGHKGRFIYGVLGGRRVIAMEGRVHYYEGYPIREVVLPVQAMCDLGIGTLIVSNAAGGLDPRFAAGDMMAIEDHINLIPNPLIGPNDPEAGVRFPDMSEPYDRQLIAQAHRVAEAQGAVLHQGVYVGTTGPSYETPAEVRYFRQIGGDAVGMSTTPEVIAARHRGVHVFGLSLITNVLTGTGVKLTHDEVIAAGREATPRMCALVERFVAEL